MAVIINATISKKVPIIGTDYASRNASITISGEVADITLVAEQAKKLFSVAESAVDLQLGITAAKPTAVSQGPSPSNSAPYPNTNRRTASISAAQLRFLRQLLERNPGAQERILNEHRVSNIESLTSRAACSIIDSLKVAQ
jgi:hypothetical protein